MLAWVRNTMLLHGRTDIAIKTWVSKCRRWIFELIEAFLCAVGCVLGRGLVYRIALVELDDVACGLQPCQNTSRDPAASWSPGGWLRTLTQAHSPTA